MNLIVIFVPFVVLILSKGFAHAAFTNGLFQLVIFALTAHIPAQLTKRMSYVDIAWPWGLIAIGIFPFFTEIQQFELRTKLVMFAFFLAGFRMAFGGAIMLIKGLAFHVEFPRYLYLRQIWAKNGITEEVPFKVCLNN